MNDWRILRMSLLLVLTFGAGALSYLLLFHPQRFRDWAKAHLDRHDTTEEDMHDYLPRGSVFQVSEWADWYCRMFGIILFLLVVFLAVFTLFGYE